MGGSRESDGPVAGACYRHFKGGRYQVVAVAVDADRGVQVVVYRDDNGTVWTRDRTSWDAPTPSGAKRFAHDGR
jgi:hypothetical protein